MISTPIPHTAKYVPVSLVFTALFNNPVIGKYSFDTTVNKGKKLLKFQFNTHFFLDSFSVGGTISELDFCRSIDVMPSLVLKRKTTGEIVYTRPLSIPKYAENRELMFFAHCDKAEDVLIADLSGSLNQILYTIGEPSISLNFAFSIFQVDEKFVNEAMRSPLAPSFGQLNRRG